MVIVTDSCTILFGRSFFTPYTQATKVTFERSNNPPVCGKVGGGASRGGRGGEKEKKEGRREKRIGRGIDEITPWLAMLAYYVSIRSTPQMTDIFYLSPTCANVVPKRQRHSVMSAKFSAVRVVPPVAVFVLPVALLTLAVVVSPVAVVVPPVAVLPLAVVVPPVTVVVPRRRVTRRLVLQSHAYSKKY